MDSFLAKGVIEEVAIETACCRDYLDSWIEVETEQDGVYISALAFVSEEVCKGDYLTPDYTNYDVELRDIEIEDITKQ